MSEISDPAAHGPRQSDGDYGAAHAALAMGAARTASAAAGADPAPVAAPARRSPPPCSPRFASRPSRNLLDFSAIRARDWTPGWADRLAGTCLDPPPMGGRKGHPRG
jgi:hypothetical protein